MPRYITTFAHRKHGSYTDRTCIGRDADAAADRASLSLSKPFDWAFISCELTTDQPSRVLNVGDDVDVFINQGEREGIVLAILGDECIVEYLMPKSGTSSLYIASCDEVEVARKSVAYHKLTRAWRTAIAQQGELWEGTPQQSRYDSVLLLSDGRVVGVNEADSGLRTGWGSAPDGLNWTSIANPCCTPVPVCSECDRQLKTFHNPACGKRVIGCPEVVTDDCE